MWPHGGEPKVLATFATLRLESTLNLFVETALMRYLLVFLLLTTNASAQVVDGAFPVVSNLKAGVAKVEITPAEVKDITPSDWVTGDPVTIPVLTRTPPFTPAAPGWMCAKMMVVLDGKPLS